jgi:hypothetical protein
MQVNIYSKAKNLEKKNTKQECEKKTNKQQ